MVKAGARISPVAKASRQKAGTNTLLSVFFLDSDETSNAHRIWFNVDILPGYWAVETKIISSPQSKWAPYLHCTNYSTAQGATKYSSFIIQLSKLHAHACLLVVQWYTSQPMPCHAMLSMPGSCTVFLIQTHPKTKMPVPAPCSSNPSRGECCAAHPQAEKCDAFTSKRHANNQKKT